ncbi:MAG TPA: hypothetical protein VKR52_01085 [Terracidiphilus sp.]|nr:hypothetical protein [Terracidiphilus sp.]
MTKRVLLCALIVAASRFAGAQATVNVEPSHLDGPRALDRETRASVIRDYLESWQTLNAALEQNRPGLLDADFVGVAKDRLVATIAGQVAQGIHTGYQDRSHDIQIEFYSPDGLSIELTDTVEYEVHATLQNKVETTQTARSRFIVVLTPSEVRWRVRVFQAESE